MPHVDTKARDRIRALNDDFRTNSNPNLGKMVLTAGVGALPSKTRAEAIQHTIAFAAFNEDNDPHGEHDFGDFEIGGTRFFFKIDTTS
jgi:Protein of unknown function (DUF3768)